MFYTYIYPYTLEDIYLYTLEYSIYYQRFCEATFRKSLILLCIIFIILLIIPIDYISYSMLFIKLA